MKYATDAAFRAALEQRLQTIAEEHRHTSLMRLRKLVVFDRLMARLLVVAPDRWVVKGGVALDLRFGHRARTTKDLDLARQDNLEQAEADLIDTQAIDLGDYFIVAVERAEVLEPDDDATAVRYRVTAEVAGRLFDRVVVDIGFGDPLPVDPRPPARTGLPCVRRRATDYGARAASRVARGREGPRLYADI